MKRYMNTLAGGAIGSLMLTAAIASPAHALGGTCTAGLEKDSAGNGRAWASCSRIEGDTKVAPKINRTWGPDYNGTWFTALNRRYYTSYYGCDFGCSGSYSIAHV